VWGWPHQGGCDSGKVSQQVPPGYQEVKLEQSVSLPAELDVRQLRRRAAGVAGALVVVALAAWLAPGLGEVRDKLSGASAGWLAFAVVLEVLSCVSYIVMFRPVFCRHMSRRTSAELALSELAVGSLVPASGAGGLALGVWALRRGGMPADLIATRTVAFFVLKSGVNFVAVAVIGAVLALGLAGPDLPLTLTLLPAAAATAAIVATLTIPWLVARATHGAPDPSAPRRRRLVVRAAGALGEGVREAGRIVRRRDAAALGGAIGYWAFDNAVLWAAYAAVGNSPALGIVLMGYLLGQLGGLLPIPGGLGGIDGGLVGALIVYGAPVSSTVAAVLAYRVILFWIPLLIGAVAFHNLRRGLNRPDRPDLCAPVATPA
jgi:uncharacterized membrane protein YbhN (UPF0104 family)